MKTQIRLSAVLTNSILLLIALVVATPDTAIAMLNFNKVTLFAVVRGGTNVAEQDSQPLFVETVSPPSGNPWYWQVSGLSGFAPTANITFTFADDGFGQPNEDHTEATMTWSGFQDSEWASGASGSFTLTLTNGVDPDRLYTVNLALRSLPSIDFTVIESQTEAETDPICAAPADGSPYTWSASGVSGIAPAPTISFTFDGGDTDQKDGRVGVTFAGDWSNQNGTFTLTLTDGSRPDSIFDGSRTGGGASQPNISLRKFVADGYTVIDGQTSGGDGVSATGANGFTFSASSYAGLAPAPTTLSFDAMGAVTACVCANWNQDGTFTLTATDGTRPGSIFIGRVLTLRQLVADGYTVFDGQTSGGDGINAAGANGFSFAASSYAGLAPAPTTLNFDAMGAVTACACVNWNQDGTFTLTATDGTRPDSVITGLNLSLRRLLSDGYTVFEQQTSGGDMVNAAGANGFTFSASGFAGLAPAPTTLSFDAMGAVTACVCANWNQNGAFILTATDGTRPSSNMPSLVLSLRQIVPESLRLVDDGSAGSVELQVQGDPGPWDWSGYTDGLASSELTAPDKPNSAKLTISWGAGDLVPSESGYGTLTIQPSDGSAPFSTVEIFTAIVGPEVWVWVDDDYTGSGYNDSHTWGYDAFDSIQDGIDAEILATLVKVAAGTYFENITMFSGVHVIGAGPDISIIDGNSSGSVVTAIDVNSTAKLAGFTIMNGSATHGGGMYCYNSSLLVSNCLLTGNSADYGGGIYNEYECNPLLTNCTFAGNTAVDGNAIACDSAGQSYPSILEIRDSIIWDGIDGIWNNDGSTITINYSDVQGGWIGLGNLDSDPNFADPYDGNYHLMSQAGRWYNQTQYLVYDDVTSPCIDAGDPSSSIGFEITPNGAVVNMGAFGGTWQASRSYFDSLPCPEPVIGDINGDCKVNFVDFAFIADHWLEDNSY
jgi:hypothetical protein